MAELGSKDTSGTARALWFPGPRRVEIRTEPTPSLGPAEVLVRTVASGISQGTEMLVYRGEVPADLPLDLPTLAGGFGFPIKYGYAAAGYVEAAGSEVRRIHEGDLVFVHHPHQTRFVVDESIPVSVPAGVTPEAAVFLANVETALNVMLDAGPRLGETVVIFGQGIVGLLLTQLMHRAGAGRVVVIEPSSMRRETALQSGADCALDSGSVTVQKLLQLTGGAGADLVVEASGKPEALTAAIDAAAREGTVVVSSWYGTKEVRLELGGAFHRGRIKIVSSQVGSINPALQPRWTRERRLEVAAGLLRELRLVPLVSHQIPFRDAETAYTLLDSRPGETLQVILTYGDKDV